MADEEILKMSGASAGTIAIVLIIYRILKTVVGKKLISNCCGKKLEVGIDVQPSTPNNVGSTLEYAQENPYHQGRPSRPREGRSDRAGGTDSLRIQGQRSTGEEGDGGSSDDSTGKNLGVVVVP
jgi:hypothetical protein